MDLLTVHTLAAVLTSQLAAVPIRKISIQLNSGVDHSFNLAFNLGQAKNNGLLKSYSMSCDEEGLITVDIIFAETAPEPQNSQATEQAPLV